MRKIPSTLCKYLKAKKWWIIMPWILTFFAVAALMAFGYTDPWHSSPYSFP